MRCWCISSQRPRSIRSRQRVVGLKQGETDGGERDSQDKNGEKGRVGELPRKMKMERKEGGRSIEIARDARDQISDRSRDSGRRGLLSFLGDI